MSKESLMGTCTQTYMYATDVIMMMRTFLYVKVVIRFAWIFFWGGYHIDYGWINKIIHMDIILQNKRVQRSRNLKC